MNNDLATHTPFTAQCPGDSYGLLDRFPNSYVFFNLIPNSDVFLNLPRRSAGIARREGLEHALVQPSEEGHLKKNNIPNMNRKGKIKKSFWARARQSEGRMYARARARAMRVRVAAAGGRGVLILTRGSLND